jgi:hypothetical protein
MCSVQHFANVPPTGTLLIAAIARSFILLSSNGAIYARCQSTYWMARARGNCTRPMISVVLEATTSADLSLVSTPASTSTAWVVVTAAIRSAGDKQGV